MKKKVYFRKDTFAIFNYCCLFLFGAFYYVTVCITFLSVEFLKFDFHYYPFNEQCIHSYYCHCIFVQEIYKLAGLGKPKIPKILSLRIQLD